MSVESWLRLALAPDVGPVLGHRLLAAFDSDPDALFAAPRERLLGVVGMREARTAGLLNALSLRLARQEADRAAAEGVTIVSFADESYPALLRLLPCPPLVLWVRGRLDPHDRLAMAMVGPRSPSQYARLMTAAIARPLAAHGLTLVSGLAYGVDGEVHRAALEAGGRTLAVVGQGLGTPLSPQANAELARRIVDEDRGAILSIFPMDAEPRAGFYPARNEIIAGLALGVLVVEASPSSGALITARHALAADRHVMACPGDATRRAAQGSNRLIADGAPLVQNAEDVLALLDSDLRREMETLGEKVGSEFRVPSSKFAPGDADEKLGTWNSELGTLRSSDPLTRRVAELLAEEPLTADALIERCGDAGHAMSAVLQRLLQLELDGHLRQMPGRLYALARTTR
jgi:DNA processing protein